MSQVTQRDYIAQQEYYKDQMRAAAQHRLARQAPAGQSKIERFYSQALTWLGRHLVAWGSSLQKRHGTMVSLSMPRSANQVAGR